MKHPNTHPKLVIVALAAVALAAAIACKKPAATTAEQAETYGAAPVKVYKVDRARITEKITYTGTLEALTKINITPEVGGKIARIYAEAGDRVAKGQLLAELETDSIRLQLRQAEAGVAVAEASHADALRNRERMDRLIKENAVSEQQREKVQLAYDAAAAQLEQARAGLNLAKHALDVSIMKAPFSGVIASKNAEVGDVINPMMGGFGGGAGGVLTLMDYSKIKLVVAISSEDIGRIRKGQEAILRVAAFPGRDFRGSVTRRQPDGGPADQEVRRRSRLRQLRTRPPARDVRRPRLRGPVARERPGRPAEGRPRELLRLRRPRPARPSSKTVTLGPPEHDHGRDPRGLAEGDVVIVEGNYGLDEGSAVQVLEEVKK